MRWGARCHVLITSSGQQERSLQAIFGYFSVLCEHRCSCPASERMSNPLWFASHSGPEEDAIFSCSVTICKVLLFSSAARACHILHMIHGRLALTTNSLPDSFEYLLLPLRCKSCLQLLLGDFCLQFIHAVLYNAWYRSFAWRKSRIKSLQVSSDCLLNVLTDCCVL